ncbi:MAG: hypothetical protein AAB225_02985 [Acidobacteriota bacterium]
MKTLKVVGTMLAELPSPEGSATSQEYRTPFAVSMSSMVTGGAWATSVTEQAAKTQAILQFMVRSSWAGDRPHYVFRRARA